MFIIVTTVGYYDLFISAVSGHAAGGFGNDLLVDIMLLMV